ncbi:hypothetical protein [Celeribacter naphthalenivorans]|uniref:hypothetical protein n=1 Tax=Celeribacter naphthalenivorans TaxID=1614694 RepID=UPI001CFAE10B|nr:hypothetical protein [Celeribacter naphthalenivorans]
METLILIVILGAIYYIYGDIKLEDLFNAYDNDIVDDSEDDTVVSSKNVHDNTMSKRAHTFTVGGLTSGDYLVQARSTKYAEDEHQRHHESLFAEDR